MSEKKRIQFPSDFFWGTSTSAAQVETASNHNWKGIKSRDGFVFDRTTDHEKRRKEDIQYITQFGTVYRCGVDWARLQKAPLAPFDEAVVVEYQAFFQELNDAGTRVLLVLHHFTNPLWFENNKEGWLHEDNIALFVDYCSRCIAHFGGYVSNWNTFNEPNVYAFNAYMMGVFPPFRKSYRKANKVLKHMSRAHQIVYDLIKAAYPDIPVGISLNTCYFQGLNWAGKIAARLADWWFNQRTARLFSQVDYCGMSYYAYVLFDPKPITEIDNPGKLDALGIRHDKMWGYYPEGFGKIIRRMYRRYKKPILITESGICTDDSAVRIRSIIEYLGVFHGLIEEGIPILGYIHWSTWDNFEWNLGPTYRFGLVSVDWETMDRHMTDAGRFYAQLTKENALVV
ncbi:MAG TPA: family 1 glycosylhydrolase [Saprospiraceae bacterium]|nr:family 1 glycosylhydrolase [Saprospiraceae bacterium]HMQ85181.1 family 1 glycosylhydrolase [Saprospiraceae bacterium]